MQQSSLLDPFLTFEENEELWIRLLVFSYKPSSLFHFDDREAVWDRGQTSLYADKWHDYMSYMMEQSANLSFSPPLSLSHPPTHKDIPNGQEMGGMDVPGSYPHETLSLSLPLVYKHTHIFTNSRTRKHTHTHLNCSFKYKY